MTGWFWQEGVTYLWPERAAINNTFLLCIVHVISWRNCRMQRMCLQWWLDFCWDRLINGFWPWSLRLHDGVIKWKRYPRHWPFGWGIHRSPVDSPHKGQSPVVLMFSLIRAWTNDWANNRDAGKFRRHRAHYDVTLMRMVVVVASLCPSTPLILIKHNYLVS